MSNAKESMIAGRAEGTTNFAHMQGERDFFANKNAPLR